MLMFFCVFFLDFSEAMKLVGAANPAGEIPVYYSSKLNLMDAALSVHTS